MEKTQIETVRFVSSKPYLNVSDEAFAELFFCTKGRSEIVVLCSNELKETLKNSPTAYITHRLSEVIKYLKSKNIPYIEEYLEKNNLKI